jgi:hypothetical protein
LPSTENGREPLRRRQTGHRATHAGIRRRAEVIALMEPGQRRREIISSAAVILAGVLVVIGFGLVASRAMQTDKTPPNVPVPAAPTLGGVILPSASTGPIPLESPSPSPSPSRTTAAPTTPPPAPPPDTGSVLLARGDVPATVNLSAEGTRDWVHWGEDGTFSLERDKDGGFTILEGAPTAPRFRHALSPQRFRWTGGDPVSSSGGTTTGIRTCGKDNGFTLSVPAGPSARTLRLYLGTVAAKGRLQARLSTGAASAVTTLDQRAASLRTARVTLTYRAPKATKLQLTWVTQQTYGSGCGGVALEAATLR